MRVRVRVRVRVRARVRVTVRVRLGSGLGFASLARSCVSGGRRTRYEVGPPQQVGGPSRSSSQSEQHAAATATMVASS